MFDILQYSFIQNALAAGTIVAVVAAVVGYFLIARGLTFAGHALSHIGFAGAGGAVLIGVSPLFGLLAFTIGAGVGIGILGKKVGERDVAIGIFLTLALGFGILFLSLYKGYAERAYGILFGSILGVSQGDVWTTAIFSAVTLIAVIALFRPLLFSSFDTEVAQARGVPVQLLGIVFMIIVAVTVSMAVTVVGVLLIFTLLVGPAATAVRVTQRPLWAIGLAVVLGVTYTWAGILLAGQGSLPVGPYIATISFGAYLLVRFLSPVWLARRRTKVQKMVGVSQVKYSRLDELDQAHKVVATAITLEKAGASDTGTQKSA